MVHRKKKQKKVEPDSPTRSEDGDAWIYTCLKRASYFFVAFAVGKWTQDTCREMIFDVARRIKYPVPNTPIEFFSDGNDDYAYVLPDYFGRYHLHYAQLVKIRKNGTLVGKERRIVFGNPEPGEIETTDVENFNGILRERCGRLVRRTKCFSKLKRRLMHAIHLFQFYWNFISNIRRGVSPAMIEGMSDSIWTWHRFFYVKLNRAN